MASFFASGHAVDFVLVIMAAEFAWLVAKAKWRVVDAALRLGPGALMLLAVRAALTDLNWPYIAVPLMLSFPAHLGDLVRQNDKRV